MCASHSVCPALCSPWTVTCKAPLSMEFSREEDWSGLPFPSPGGLLDSGIKLRSPVFRTDSLPTEPPGKLKKKKANQKKVGKEGCVSIAIKINF